ncbi:hypothetical protein AV926_18425 [Myroides marinus]|uniref:Ion-translocating oxidoreductase complex subunit C n=1 Tax=Myroides marinus TaxID=703342 RepID=A0A163UIA3_9FLAO|nr:electron transport complex subunit RsxC [Myroides marinus]KZE73360.1 hypothetical protein AV926_18425 [Myroides marinus]
MLLIPSLKKYTKKSPIQVISEAEDYYIPLSSYRGNMNSIVKEGEKVKKYQLLAQCDGVFATKAHAPISGIVKGIFHLNDSQFLHIQNDFQDREISIDCLSIDNINQDQFAEILLEYGIEGAGGSRFPTTLKYRENSNKIRTLIFNGVECEPYLSADYVLMQYQTKEIIEVAAFIKKIIGAEQLVFAIEKQNKELKKQLESVAKEKGINIKVQLLPNSYPQGGELQLIKAITGMELKKGSIPAQYGILVNNIGTLWAMYKAIFEGKPNIERIITISGNRCFNPGNFRVKIGTPIAHILRETNNVWNSEEQIIVLGGAMMGKVISSKFIPINKGSGGLLVMQKNNLETNNCIKCGLCIDVCPQKLMPLEFARFNLIDDIESLANYHLQDCIECGACAYICPSQIPLIENILDGKKKLINSH